MSPDVSLDEEITLFDRNGAACVFRCVVAPPRESSSVTFI